MNDTEKKHILWTICRSIEGSQNSLKGSKNALKDLKTLYYKEKSSKDASGRHQKNFSGLLWQAMFIPFKDKKCSAQENIIEMFTKFAKTAGTLDDIEEFGFPYKDVCPFFIRVFQIYKKQNGDERYLVRLRHTELVYEILKVHGNSPVYEGTDLKKDLFAALSQRIRDKQPSIRSVAFKCLHFFLDHLNSKLVEEIKYHAEFDPSCEARKSAFILICALPSLKSSFIINKAYDCEESVRIEAFKALVRVPIVRLKRDQRVSIIQWGLMQPAPKVKKILLEELIPAWVKGDTCKNSIVNFLTLLDVARSSRTAELLLSALYPDDSDESFSKVDLSFLNENHLVTISETNFETIVYWHFLSKRFHNQPFSREKIIPGPGELTQLIYQIIESIHEEHEGAIRESRPEEFENILCLAQVLRIAVLCDYEEGSRGTMESALRIILRDPILDEAVIIHVAVDVAHKILGHGHFNEFMMEIIKELFEPQVEVRRRKSHALREKNMNKQSEELNFNTSRQRTLIDEDSNKSLGSAEPVQGAAVPKKIRLTDDEIQRLKSERGELMLRRHRMVDQKDKAIRNSNFLQAHQFNEEIVKIKQLEEEMHKIIQDHERNELCPDLSPEFVRKQSNSLVLSPIVPLGGTLIDDEDDDDDAIEDQPENENESQEKIPFGNRLRGIVMFTRFLTWQTELSSFSRTIYDLHTCPSLEEQDHRVRLHAIYIIGMVGLLDPSEAKMALAVMINAIGPHEDVRVRLAAFKVVVDLLLQHDFSVFKITEEEMESRHLLPHPMKEFYGEISVDDMQKHVLEILDKFPGEAEDKGQNVKHICIKFLGVMKLLIRGRIKNENVIAQLLKMWADPSFTGTPLCFHIGHWVPLYCNMGVSNALRLGSAFVKCIKNNYPEGAKEEEEPGEVHIDKLAAFVFSNTNARSLGKFEGGSTVHAHIAIKILTEMNRSLNCPNILMYVRCLKMLEFNDEPYVTKIRRKINNFLLDAACLSTKGLRPALVLFEKQLNKRFGPLIASNETDFSEMENDEDSDVVMFDDRKSEDESVPKIDDVERLSESLRRQQNDIRNALDDDNDDDVF